MKNRVGEVHKTTKGESLTIIEYFGTYNCTVQFEDGTILKNKAYSAIKTKEIYNPNLPHIYDKFFIGVGKYKPTLNSSSTKIFDVWYSMIKRCYDPKSLNRNTTYIGCSISEDWYNFQNFGKWFEENYNPEIMEDWHLDKDILIKNNKIYSPETCCFVPQEINILFIKNIKKKTELPIGVCRNGSYFRSRITIEKIEYNLGNFKTPKEAFQVRKIAKENRIKELADKWRGKITEPTYQAMYDYKVEITD